MIIVTHKKPHLDEIVAAWLLKTFDPQFKDCRFEYISQNPSGTGVPTGPDYIGLGIGRGKYDEHGLRIRESATHLVYQDLMHRGLIPNDQHEDKALGWLVEYAHKQDTGQWDTTDPQFTSFSIPAILRGIWQTNREATANQAEMDFGLTMIDAIMAQLNERAKFDADWDKRIEFESNWGKAVAITSTYRASDAFAYHQGFVLRVQKDPTKDYGDFRGPANSSVDLSVTYDIVNQQEPGTWFLHQSKKILVASNDPKANLPTTKLSLPQLIDLVKKQ